jgi:hypothetical protein
MDVIMQRFKAAMSLPAQVLRFYHHKIITGHVPKPSRPSMSLLAVT